MERRGVERRRMGSRCMGGRWLSALAVVVIAAQAAAAQTPGKITEVRVYRGQALVTRAVEFDAQAGAQDVVITALPAAIVPSSLYASGDEGLSIRAVRYRQTAVEEEPRAEVREVEEKLETLAKETRRIESALAVLEKRNQYLDKLEQFVAPTAQVEMTKGVLDPEALTQLTEMMFNGREKIATEKLEAEERKAAIAEERKLLERKRAEFAAGETKVLREAVVFLEAARAGRAHLSLSYLVDGVGWSPAYTARLEDKRDRLVLEYHAVVTQTSGEDWPDVKLTLSTSNPTMLADAPILSPLWIGLAAGAKQQVKSARDFAEQLSTLNRAIRGSSSRTRVQQRAQQEDQPAAQDFLGDNVTAAQLQNLELAAPDDVVGMSKGIAGGEDEGLAVDYPMPGRISLRSRRDQQMFRIASLDLSAKAYYVAVPLLSEYVYQAVEAVNSSDVPLLAGPYNAYLDGAFAGRGRLPLVARGQSLTIGFGTETRLRAARELEEKKTDIRGGNQVVRYTYRFRLQNFMSEAVEVRVWDRLPQAPDQQVTVTLLELKPGLSEDPLYVAQDRPRGLLRWDIEVPALASGAKAHAFSYGFQLEYDRNLTIGELPAQAVEKMKAEVEFEMRARGY
ncbi:MAG: mucoidy inhibitor MuiA family protein [Planctomycetes bacterium]|nr:mucoidy inhibitor MuiA family protein [Planctomycetota bacterium]